jgi:hypothetical protein
MHALTIDTAITEIIKGTRENGGHTASVLGIDVPKTGYMVGGYVDSLIFDASLILDGEHDEVVWRMIIKWVSENFTLATKFSMFLGGWIDTETGEAYIDLSQHFAYEDSLNAMMTANFHDEIAIWDLGKGEEIRVS